jgi:hypothetical protein
MFRWISILGGLLIMMGHHACSEALFYYFRLAAQRSASIARRAICSVWRLVFLERRGRYRKRDALSVWARRYWEKTGAKPLP